MLKIESDPYSLFLFAMNAPQTREKYVTRLKKFYELTNIPGSTMQEKCRFFADKGKEDNSWLVNGILEFVQRYKARVERKEITGATLRNYVKTVKLFCDMNDLVLPWKKITRGLPKGRKYADDRAPTLEEIQKLVEYPDRRIKAIVYTMTSSGIRLGAWEYLQWGHIMPIRNHEDRILAAKITVYAGDEEEYFSFITYEAYHELEKWIEFRRNCGELISKKSWILRDLWDTRNGTRRGLISEPMKLKPTGVKRLMEDALWTQGLRKKLEPGKRRHEFQTDHGFRKWFKTRCEIAGMKPINIEKLMGHSTGISDSYYRATENEFLEDYLKANDALTINENHLLKRKFDELEQKRTSDIGKLNIKLQDRSQEIELLQRNDFTKNDAIAALSDKLQELASEVETLKNQK